MPADEVCDRNTFNILDADKECTEKACQNWTIWFESVWNVVYLCWQKHIHLAIYSVQALSSSRMCLATIIFRCGLNGYECITGVHRAIITGVHHACITGVHHPFKTGVQHACITYPEQRICDRHADSRSFESTSYSTQFLLESISTNKERILNWRLSCAKKLHQLCWIWSARWCET